MVSLLNRGWRLFGTAVSFSTFGIGAIIMTVTAFPMIRLLMRDDIARKRHTQLLIHWSFRQFVRLMSGMGVIDFDTRDQAVLQQCRGKLIIANHPSLIDVVLIMSLMDRAQCVVKHQYWDSFLLGGVMRNAGYIRNDADGEEIIRQCRASFERGENVILFPEGTRTVPGEPLKFQRGFANVATRAPVDVQLVKITCTPTTLTKGEPWYDIPVRRPRFSVEVLKQLDIADYLGQEPPAVAARKLTRDLEEFYGELLRHG